MKQGSHLTVGQRVVNKRKPGSGAAHQPMVLMSVDQETGIAAVKRGPSPRKRFVRAANLVKWSVQGDREKW